MLTKDIKLYNISKIVSVETIGIDLLTRGKAKAYKPMVRVTFDSGLSETMVFNTVEDCERYINSIRVMMMRGDKLTGLNLTDEYQEYLLNCHNEGDIWNERHRAFDYDEWIRNGRPTCGGVLVFNGNE